jgi:uncharacterized protein
MKKNSAKIINLEEKIYKLKNILKDMRSAVIAFSGGVDSSLLVKIAADTLGKNVIAVTAKSPLLPKEELAHAKKMSKSLDCRHIIVNSNVLEIKEFLNNPKNRCYLCKRQLFLKLILLKNEYNLNFVIDGTNFDDHYLYRPGLKAAEELGVRSPLAECRLSKEEIRKYSKLAKLSFWDRPASSCLATRIPYGEKISKSRLEKISAAEEYLRFLGFRHNRVRYYYPLAKIEVAKEEIPKILQADISEKIIKKFKKIGFRHITIDIEGYRTGSMDE